MNDVFSDLIENTIRSKTAAMAEAIRLNNQWRQRIIDRQTAQAAVFDALPAWRKAQIRSWNRLYWYMKTLWWALRGDDLEHPNEH